MAADPNRTRCKTCRLSYVNSDLDSGSDNSGGFLDGMCGRDFDRQLGGFSIGEAFHYLVDPDNRKSPTDIIGGFTFFQGGMDKRPEQAWRDLTKCCLGHFDEDDAKDFISALRRVRDTPSRYDGKARWRLVDHQKPSKEEELINNTYSYCNQLIVDLKEEFLSDKSMKPAKR